MRNLSIKLILTFLLSGVIFNFTIHAQKAELVVQTGYSTMISSVAFSPNGKVLAGSSDNTIKLWDVKTGKELRTIFTNAKSIISVVSMAFSLSGKQIASLSSDNTIKLWDVENGEELKPPQIANNNPKSIAFSSNGELQVSSDEAEIYSPNIDKGGKLQNWQVHEKEITSLMLRREKSNDKLDR